MRKHMVMPLLLLVSVLFSALIFYGKESFGEAGFRAKPAEDPYFIEYTNDFFTEKIPLERFLIGVLASSISMEYRTETLKAQAILLRSSLVLCFQKAGTTMLPYEDLALPYWDEAKAQTFWGKQHQAYLKKCTQAVQKTRGLILMHDTQVMAGDYHAMSAGATRDGSAVLGGSFFSYLKSTSCPSNAENEHYLQTFSFAKDTTIEVIARDEQGYVLRALFNKEPIGGEALRLALGLPSANFQTKEEADSLIIETRGVGHGFGLDQSYANVLAKSGMGYVDILYYFFDGVSIEKIKKIL